MCVRCEKVEAEIEGWIKTHTCGDECIVPKAGTDYRSSVFWLLAIAHAKLDITLDRMDTAKRLFDNPEDVSPDVLREWEDHVIAAAELFARARHRREVATRQQETRQ